MANKHCQASTVRLGYPRHAFFLRVSGLPRSDWILGIGNLIRSILIARRQTPASTL
ncbi:hypothetical protein V8F44DRAFT_479955 [Aspergillus fumigatus]